MEALGIDLKYLIFQLINFGLLVLALTYLLGKPIHKLLDSRKKEIEDGLSNAAKAKEELEKAEVKQQELLDAAEKAGRQLIEEVRIQGKELEEQLSKESTAKAERLLEQTREEMQAERERLHQALKEEIATMVITATEKVLEQPISDKEKRQQISELVKDIRR